MMSSKQVGMNLLSLRQIPSSEMLVMIRSVSVLVMTLLLVEQATIPSMVDLELISLSSRGTKVIIELLPQYIICNKKYR